MSITLEVAAFVATALAGFGLMALVFGVVPSPVPVGRPTRQFHGARFWRRLPQKTRWLLAIGALLGLIAAVVGGWVIAIPLFPAAAVGVPWLLGNDQTPRQIERLKAMEEWTRTLTGVLVAGMSLEQAIQVSLKSTNEQIRPEVSRLVGRLNARLPTAQALTLFAADLDDPTGDLIVASLRMGATRRGAGLAVVLADLAESVSAEVRARQRIDADRATHRTTARGVTLITLIMLAGLAASGSYIDPYKQPFGQAILAVALLVYVVILVQLKRMGQTPTPPRFLHVSKAPAGATTDASRASLTKPFGRRWRGLKPTSPPTVPEAIPAGAVPTRPSSAAGTSSEERP
ncbi:MAG: type II secretion system F family protein [Propionibacteriaceae bacterium]|jgi:Flp pilus assembly protein TadB|nr:type II secretion system F family protein [Propionibacteriaceae bacterium]